jgi:hypothetical protein
LKPKNPKILIKTEPHTFIRFFALSPGFVFFFPVTSRE